MTADLIHTDLALNAWQETTEVAPVRDTATGIATVRLPVVFRGSRLEALRAFPYGAQNCPQGGQGMFCLGPSDIQLIPYTGANPHWDMMVEWQGIHSQITPSVGSFTDLAFDIKIDWTHREKEYPEEIPTPAGDPLRFSPGHPFAPSGTSTGGALRKSKRFDHLPTATINVVMRDSTAPHPQHPKINTIISKLPRSWPTGVIHDYKGLTEPIWVTWSKRPAPKSLTGGVTNSADWFIRQIANQSRISRNSGTDSMALHVFTITATLEQMLQPS